MILGQIRVEKAKSLAMPFLSNVTMLYVRKLLTAGRSFYTCELKNMLNGQQNQGLTLLFFNPFNEEDGHECREECAKHGEAHFGFILILSALFDSICANHWAYKQRPFW